MIDDDGHWSVLRLLTIEHIVCGQITSSQFICSQKEALLVNPDNPPPFAQSQLWAYSGSLLALRAQELHLGAYDCTFN